MTETTTKKKRSYFVTDSVNRYQLDEEAYIEHKKLDEGLFQAYQDITSKIRVDRTGEHTEVDMKLGEQRRFLLDNLVTGWNLTDEEDKPVKFTHNKLMQLDPSIITGLIDDIYEKNEILSGERDSDEGKDRKNGKR